MTVSSHKVGTKQWLCLVALQALDELGCEVGDSGMMDSDEMRERRREKESPEEDGSRQKVAE